MAKASKLPSGNWRVRQYSHTDSNGKKHYESFTAPTKEEAKMLAVKFAKDNDRKRASDITVKDAVNDYIKSNEGVLSPSTLRGYRIDRKRFVSIDSFKIRQLKSVDIQRFISDLAAKGLAPKTIKNTYTLLLSALKFSGIDAKFSVHLPTTPRNHKNAPEIEDVARLYEAANPRMKICIALAAGHSLRRGEIAALKYGDISGNELYVHADMVIDSSGHGWIYKETPKTADSNRIIYLSDSDLELIGTGKPDEYITQYVPSSIGDGFSKLCKRLGIKMRFHDLRGFFASSAAEFMPDFYISKQGGWRNGSATLKRHYQKPINSLNEAYANKMNDFIDTNIKKYDTKYDTESEKAAN